MSDLQRLPNIGPVVAQQLIQAGIETPEQLRELGSREAWLRILAFDPSACVNRLMGLEGAIRGMRYKDLPEQDKAQLRAFVRHHKG